MTRQVAEHPFVGTGPFVLRAHVEAGRHVRPRREVLGDPGPACRHQFTFYDQRRRGPRRCTGGTVDVVRQFSVASGQQLLQRQLQRHPAQVDAHRERRCEPTSPVHRARVARRSRSASTGPPPSTRCSRASPTSATTDRSRRYPVHQHDRPAAGPEHRRGEVVLSAAGLRPGSPPPADRQRRTGDTRVRGRGVGGEGHRGEHQRQDRGLVGVLRQGHLRELDWLDATIRLVDSGARVPTCS